MTRIRPIVIAFFACLILARPILGDDTQSYRTWTDSTGKHKIEAALVKVEDDKVHLKRKDTGKVITISKQRLSTSDQDFLARQQSGPATKQEPKSQSKVNSPGTKMAFTGTWNNRKYGTSGALHCLAVVKDDKTWTAKFDGDGVYGKFSYDVSISTKQNSKQVQLEGNSTVSGHRYKWSGNVKDGVLFGKYTASNGNNGTFRLKQVTSK